jgi:phenylacetic acid degradation operon negative regulatory protein
MLPPVENPPGGGRGADTRPSATPAAHLVMTLLGDYWYGTTDHVPSAAIVALLAEFDVGADAARAALSRLCRDGRIDRVKDGRRTSYRSSAGTRRTAATRARRLMRFGAEPVPWDGRWTCVAFSVPEADRHLRSALRHRLRRLGMGPLFDGLWISPHPLLGRVDATLTALGIDGAAVFRAEEVDRRQGVDLLDAWDLVCARSRIGAFRRALDVTAKRMDDGAVDPAQALIARTDLMARWRVLAATDPRIPDELLPADWPLADARHRFVEVYDALGPLSEQRVRQIVGDATGDDDSAPPDGIGTGPSRRGGPRHHRIADLR